MSKLECAVDVFAGQVAGWRKGNWERATRVTALGARVMRRMPDGADQAKRQNEACVRGCCAQRGIWPRRGQGAARSKGEVKVTLGKWLMGTMEGKPCDPLGAGAGPLENARDGDRACEGVYGWGEERAWSPES